MAVQMQGLFYSKAAMRSLVVSVEVSRLVEGRQLWVKGEGFAFFLVKATPRHLATYISLPQMLDHMAPAVVCT